MKTIDIQLVYNSLIDKLRKFNFLDTITDIEKSSVGSATSLEALMIQGKCLLSLKQLNPTAFELIHEQINDYIEYCRQHGLIVR